MPRGGRAPAGGLSRLKVMVIDDNHHMRRIIESILVSVGFHDIQGLLSRINAAIQTPRLFIRCRTYFGPDRRRGRPERTSRAFPPT